MSRSNGPVTRGGGQAQDWQRGTEPDQSAENTSHPYHWPALSPEPAPYGYHQGAPYHPQHPSAPEPEPQFPPYNYPQDAGGSHQPFSTPAQHPPFFGPQDSGQSSHSPQYDRYPADQNHQGGYQPNGHDQRGLHYRQHEAAPLPEPQHYAPRQDRYPDQGLAQLQPTGQPGRGHSTLRDQLNAVQYDQWQQSQDPREYDLGSYMPAQSAGQPAYGGPGSPSQNGQFDPHWQDPHAYQDHSGEPPAGAAGYYAQLGQEALPVAGHEHPLDDADAEDADDYEYEESGRGRRGLLIVSALVGAIIVGGGLAYGYKTIIGPSPKATPPVIQADARPAKSQPEDPGGKQFAHSDSKLMGRLENDGDSANGRLNASDDTDSAGVRRVPTIMVSRDGSIAPPPAEPRLPPTTVSVPGMTIVDGFGSRAQPPVQPARRVEPVQSPGSAVAAPRIIAKATPAAEPATPVVEPVSTARAEPTPPPPVRSAALQPAAPRPTPERPIVVRQPPVQQPAAAPAPRASSVGYVAVLASQKSRIDALKTFADLQQKYVSVLQNKIPDVQEADLSARGLGTMYRVVVGPPSSREAAADICGQLKTAGFQGCWVTAY